MIDSGFPIELITNYVIIVIGVTAGITKKLQWEEFRLRKELLSIALTICIVIYDYWFVEALSVQRGILLFVIVYFSASGIYNFIPRNLNNFDKPNDKEQKEDNENE